MYKKTLIALATTAAFAASVPAQAASAFYLTIPITARGTAPIADVSVNLANGTLANAMVGEPYLATVKKHLAVTGDEAFNFNRVGWGVSTGSLPAGLNFDVTTGAITGTPTAPGANSFGITATYRGKADEGMFNLSVMEILLALQNNTLPAGTIGAPYSAGLQNFLTVTGDQAFNGSNVGWSFTSGALPAGLVLNAETGAITGTPTAPASAPFVVSATYRGKTASGTYSVSVLDITVNLAAATLPDAVINEAYSADLAAKLAVANDATFTPGTTPVNWTISSGTLPAGLTLSAAGLVAGTPTARTTGPGESFQVKATYKGKAGQQTYTIVVGGVTLQVSKIAAGDNHTCAITSAGALKCWGSNASGQLGDGTVTTRMVPTLVTGMTSDVTGVAAGTGYTCAIKSGSLKCWGSNASGQLGDGTTNQRSTPTQVSGLTEDVTMVSVGYLSTTCAVVNGAAKCWGYNAHGQVGDGSSVARTTPQQVINLTGGVTAISAGYVHSCAIKAGGLHCWGYNDQGQLGIGTSSSRNDTVAVYGMSSGIVAVATGYHTCAINSAGALKCWGYNAHGPLGIGTTANQYYPTAVIGMASGVATLSAGPHSTCATTDSGGLKCWGYNAVGQLGNGTTSNFTTPTQVTGLTEDVTGVSIYLSHACATLKTGMLKCWGQNNHGQSGDGTTAARLTPVTAGF